jgi:hypothetical protein
MISYLYHPRAIASATEPSDALFAATAIAAYIAVFAVPIKVSTFADVIFADAIVPVVVEIFADVMFTDAIVPVVVEMFADVIFAVVILAVTAVKAAVTFALLNVELPVTDNVFAKVPEPDTIKSSKPIASSVILPDTVKSPEIPMFPTTVELP